MGRPIYSGAASRLPLELRTVAESLRTPTRKHRALISIHRPISARSGAMLQVGLGVVVQTSWPVWVLVSSSASAWE